MARDLSGGQGEAFHIEFGAVANVKIGPKLASAKNGNFAFVDRVIGQAWVVYWPSQTIGPIAQFQPLPITQP